jgi:hypothetical protein
MATPLWIDAVSAARLLGVSKRFVLQRANAGAYGQTRREAISNAVLISTRALELAACRIFEDRHVAAAIRGEPNLWRFPSEERPELGGLPLDHSPSVEAIACAVATTRHANEEEDNHARFH